MKKNKLLITSFFVFILFINASAQEKAVPVFKDGEAQVVAAFEDPDNWIRHDLWVETGFDTDGNGRPDRMHVDVTRPLQTETEGLKLPVIYVTSPYFAGVAGGGFEYFWDIYQEVDAVPPERKHPPEIIAQGERPIISNSHINTWVPRGYIVVHSSSPGTGMSDGSPTVGGPNETLAPKAVIDWLCGRAKGYSEREGGDEVEAYWCTGKVGMTGGSYNGTLPVAAATTGVEGLEAIIPIAPGTSYYHYYRSNGLVVYPGGWPGEDIDVLFDFIHSGKMEYREYARETIRDGEMAAGQDRVTGDMNAFWDGRDYLKQMDNWKAALLMSHGFNDWNVQAEHSYRIYNKVREMGVPCQIYYHQGGHGGQPPLSMMNKWFTRYLHGVENGVENDPKAWIVREDDKMSEPTPYEDYPNPKASPVTLNLTGGAPEKGGLTTDEPEPQSPETLVDNYSFSGNMLAQAEITDHRLLYVTPVLKEDLHISGIPSITIKVMSSKPAANLSVWLVSLPWSEGRRSKITDNLINRTWADIQNYRSLYESEPLARGRFYELTFNFQPDDQVIKAGQQIGLMIMGSDKDFTLRPEPGTELTVDLDGTSITIPVVGGKDAYLDAIK